MPSSNKLWSTSTKSGRPSPFKSFVTTDVVTKDPSKLPVGDTWKVANLPLPSPNNVATGPVKLSPTNPATRSSFPSPFMSATAAQRTGAGKLYKTSGANVPLPLPSKTPTVPVSASATTKSRTPIPRRSALTTCSGETPASGIITGNCAVPSPSPVYSQRSLLPPSLTTQSIFPSRLKSPVATLLGKNPAGKVGWNAKPGRLCGCERVGTELEVVV